MQAEDKYVFPRDYLDNDRINLQHYLWVRLFGYLLHPSIPTENPCLKVADIGTGTGIWLSDLTDKLPPSVELHGLDISFAATAPPEWLPSNIKLRQWDVLSDPPQDLLEAFDVVHIRLFSLVLSNNDVNSVLGRLQGLLKPGGYLQWAEPDMSTWRTEKTSSHNKADALEQILKLSQGDDARLRPTWVPNLPTLFRNQGLEDIEVDVKEVPPHLLVPMHECSLLIPELLIRKDIYTAPVRDQMKGLLEEAARETAQGSAWAFTRWSLVGRKPLTA
ncbi:uncharacterized protein LDX57_010555 [Aspergillus melleus]|uniref:uncharacterized protein n=1 Tax=Aspergillus melleus TaxID=138277 RepID=UPI001E8E0B44|nr:uncharacterized protein LDX57_010555 [Aspergillus melleus]KAH8432922.1 hypothetical protein LDX57_010555 [Aspergillus melleus]